MIALNAILSSLVLLGLLNQSSEFDFNNQRLRQYFMNRFNLPNDFDNSMNNFQGSNNGYNIPTNPPVTPTYPTNPPITPTYPTNPPITPTFPTNPPITPTNGYGNMNDNSGVTSQPENLIYGISFDCSNKVTGFYRDTRYCDIFHVCVSNQQKKTYACPQVGDVFYYDESLRRCEFASRNPNGCPSNNYYQKPASMQPQSTYYPPYTQSPYTMPFTQPPFTQPPYGQSTYPPYTMPPQTTYLPYTMPPQSTYPPYTVPFTQPPYTQPPYTQPPFTQQPYTQQPYTQPPYTQPPYTQPPYTQQPFTQPPFTQPPFTQSPYGQGPGPVKNETVEPWKIYVRQNEPFTCSGKSDAFYASRWCNVFYRCFNGIKYEFLCAKQTNGDRLWWSQHSTSQSLPQATAQCAFPCDTKRQCSSSGGVLIENGNTILESQSEGNRILSACQTNNNNNNNNAGDDSNDFFKLPDGDNNCGGVADGTFQSDSRYCNVFHVCFAGKRKDFQCAKASNNQYDLWWNDKTMRCEWPCKVQCNKQIYGASKSSSDIQSLDRNINAAECANSGGSNGGNIYGSGK